MAPLGHRPSWAPEIAPRSRAGGRPLWSVMIPTYESALLERTLESVLAQAPGPEVMQIEVVDDGSVTEDPAPRVKRVAGDRVQVFRQPHNVGAAANFTTCVRRSRGDWVHILHSDDVVRPGFYERYGERIAACPDAVMVAAQTFTVDPIERFVGITPPLGTEHGYVADAAFVVATDHPLAAASVVVARRSYELVGGFHPDLPHTNDWEMWTRLASSGPVAWVDEPLALYRSHDASDSNRMHRTTGYLDECLRAVAVFSEYFPPDRQDAVRRGAARAVARYATAVGHELVGRHQRRLAFENAFRAVRIDPSIHTVATAGEVAAQAVAAAARDRLDDVRRRTVRSG
ncbi:MAG: glycosyltransferase family 2 protein [Acidimicrobiia bacterium]